MFLIICVFTFIKTRCFIQLRFKYETGLFFRLIQWLFTTTNIVRCKYMIFICIIIIRPFGDCFHLAFLAPFVPVANSPTFRSINRLLILLLPTIYRHERELCCTSRKKTCYICSWHHIRYVRRKENIIQKNDVI